MVAGSRSSLRRPTLRGHKSSRSTSPLGDDAPPLPLPLPLPPPAADAGISNSRRSKRVRSSTISGPEQSLKRRRLSPSNKGDIPQLRIPLRSRVPKVVSPPAVGTPNVQSPKAPPNSSLAPKPIDSPSSKPQYDQIRIIEEKARASIRGGALAVAQDERRKLRSEDGGSRAKTELAQYFPDFEEMLSLRPSDPEALTAHTKVVLVDDTVDFEPPAPRVDPFGAHKPLHKTELIQLSQRGVSTNLASHDPLSEDSYIKIHAKAERHEKQMKNGDRERAQHEKYQLEKLLDDLRGPDWLKTLGITGITETEKKRYEPKRALFIRETQALIDKFKRWKEEEKRRKLEREQALLEEAMEDEEGDDDQDVDEDEDEDEDDAEEDSPPSSDDEGSVESTSSRAPNSSEIDALASQQLIEEANNANKRKKYSWGPADEPAPPPPPPPPRPFVSFFDKRHLRDAAVAGRHRGRTVLAFGHPVPEFWETEFNLPDDILTEEAIRASQRSRRRMRRGTSD